MCGFAGLINTNYKNNFDLLKTVSAMGDRISHRGPDNKGIWINEEKNLAFVHQRLSILELSPAGNQPMLSKCGRFMLVFNGEIYNHKKLKIEIENNTVFKEIYSWIGKSDTEILLASITFWGVLKTLKKIVGMFSIACWDLHDKTLFLARDRFGEKPLYFGYKNNLFAFASELKAFENINGFPLEVNREIIPFYLKRNFIPAPYSIYKDIKKLKPGTYLKINHIDSCNQFELKENKYWNLSSVVKESQNNKLFLNNKKIIEKLDYLLKESIQDQLIADVPVGAFLSGGIDSSLVVSIMQSLTKKKIRTYTIGFKESLYDESMFAKKITKYLGTDHKELIITAKEALEIIKNIANIYDEPFADVSQIPMILIAKHARNEVKVCLTGDGGDEIFGGYNRYIFGANIWNIIKFIPYKLRSYSSYLISSFPDQIFNNFLLKISLFLPRRLKLNLLDQKKNKFANLLKARNQSEIYDLIFSKFDFYDDIVLGVNKEKKLEIDTQEYDILDPTHNMILKDMNSYLPDDVLVKVDRAAMHVSLETRLPMLDHRLASYALRIPTSKKIRFFKGKYLLRKLLNKYLPANIYSRPKSGFSVPISDWLRGPLKEWADNLINPERIMKEGYFDSQILDKRWKEHLSGNKNWSSFIWSVLMFQVWLENNEKLKF